MNVKELQKWLNDKGANPKVVEDGIGGPKTRNAFIQVFTNKNATAVTESDITSIAQLLGDTSNKRIKAVAKVESGGGAYTNEGLVKILWERHLFYKYVNRTIYFVGYKNEYISFQKYGGYTLDINDNKINDSWEKLSYAVCIDPDGALQSISIGKFQVLGKYYSYMGYKHPIDMLWDARNSEASHYRMLANYILKVANLKPAFLRISTNSNTCRDFAKGYNGPSYTLYEYHIKIANALKSLNG